MAADDTSKPAKAPQDYDLLDPGFWTSEGGGPVGSGWEFGDGEIRLANPGRGTGGNIVSAPLPPNFDLRWQWKIDRKVNSGLKYRVRQFETPEYGTQTLGLEYQIIDDGDNRGSIGSTASIYDLVPPAADKPLKPVGEWNEARVVAVGSRLEHYLNGQLVAQADLTTPDWQRRIALSKFYGAEGFGLPKAGDRLMLTDHGGRASYRDFHFTPLDPPAGGETGDSNAIPPFLADGIEFKSLSRNSVVVATRTTQQPQRSENDTGAAGRVRATYWPGWHRHRARQTNWVTTSKEDRFAAEWKLEGLEAGTTYHVVIEATQPDAKATTAVARRSFSTAVE